MTTFDDRAHQAATAVREAARDSDLEMLLERIEDAHARPWWIVPTLVAGAAAATITAILVVPGLLGSSPTPVIDPAGSEDATSEAPTAEDERAALVAALERTDAELGAVRAELDTATGPRADALEERLETLLTQRAALEARIADLDGEATPQPPPPTSTVSCEPGDIASPATATDGLSPAARDTYDRMVAAAEACDLAALVAIADEGEPVLVSFGGSYLDEAWLEDQRSTQAGLGIVEILRRTLALSKTVEETGDGLTIHSWPAAFGELTPETERELLDSGLYTEDDLEGFRDFGGFIGWRVGITDDGDWIYLVAGD